VHFETVNHPRYIDAIVSALYLGAAYVVINAFNNDKLKITVGILMAALMTVQSFYTLDPIMKKNFRNINVGKTSVITTSEILSDGMAYNRQYQSWGRVMDLALHDIDLENADIYMATLYDDTWHFDAMGVYMTLTDGKAILDETWDPVRKTRITDLHDGVLQFEATMVNADADIDIDEGKSAYYLYCDIAGSELAEKIKQDYQYEEQIFEDRGWVVKRIEFFAK
jgi:hypothetical protein